MQTNHEGGSMRKLLGVLFIVMLTLQGCTRQTSDDLKELGNDAKRDINKAARNIDDKVQDAVD